MIQKPLNHEAYLNSHICKEITNSGKDTPDGLYSEEIFGITTEDRVRIGAMFNLKSPVMRPNIVLLLKRFSRTLYNCVTGAAKSKKGFRLNYVILDGVLYREDDTNRPDFANLNTDIEAQKQAGVGPVFLYNNWHKLDFNKMVKVDPDSQMKYANTELRQIFKKYKLNEIFQKYIYILPIGYRENKELGGRIQVDQINDMYAEIINISQALQQSDRSAHLQKSKTDFEIQLQMSVINFYETLASRYLGVNGALKKKLIARTIDGSARMVILPNTYSSNIIGESKIGIDATGIPIHHLVAMFRPFVIKHAMDFVQELQLSNILVSAVDDERDISLRYGIDVFTEMIENMEDISYRIKPFPILDFDNTEKPLICEFEVMENGAYKKVTKELSILEFFYIVLTKYMNITETKTVATTRYPVDAATSIQTLKPVPLTLTGKLLRKVKFMNYEYDDFPYVDEYIKANSQEKIFEQAERISAGTATAVGGDFDGDTMLQKPLLTKEATEDARSARNNFMHTFSYGGRFIRDVGKAPVQTLYSLTRNPKPEDKSKDIPESHEFIQYLLSIENGHLDLNKLYAYTRSFKIDEKPEISVYDTVTFKFHGKPIKTTVGRLIIIKTIFSPVWDSEYFEYPEGVITGDTLINIFRYISFLIMEGKIKYKGTNPLNRMVDIYIELTTRLSTMFNASLSTTMMNPDDKFTKFRNDTIESDKKRIVEEADVDTATANEEKVLDFAKEHFKNDDMYELFISGGSASWANHFKTLCISVGATPSMDGGKSNIIIDSLMDGVKAHDIPHTFNAGLTGAYLRGVASARAGDFGKRTMNGLQTVYIEKGDCGSTRGVPIKTSDVFDLLGKRVIESSGKQTLITTDNVKSYLNKDIIVRSPLYCKHKHDNYCSACAGESTIGIAGSDKIPAGILTYEISAGLLNAYMKATHNLTQGITRVKDIASYIVGVDSSSWFELRDHQIICTQDMDLYLSNSDTCVKPNNDAWNIYGLGKLVSQGKSGTLTFGAFFDTKPDIVTDEGEHRKFSYKKGSVFMNNTVVPKDVDTVYLMLKLIFDGKFLTGVPLEHLMKGIKNTMKLNQKIKASDVSFEILLATLARDKNDQTKPARETGGEYTFVSTTDMAAINGTFTALMSGDTARGLIINMSSANSTKKQTVSPVEKALKM